MTKNGKLIMEIIYASNDHLTAEQIFLRAKETAPGMVLATVYNNLKTLVAEGLVRRVTMEDGPDRYDRPMRHDHLICVKCGKISDLMFKDLSEKLERDIGAVSYTHLDVYKRQEQYSGRRSEGKELRSVL